MLSTRAFFYIYLPIHDSWEILSLKSSKIFYDKIIANLLYNSNEIVGHLKTYENSFLG